MVSLGKTFYIVLSIGLTQEDKKIFEHGWKLLTGTFSINTYNWAWYTVSIYPQGISKQDNNYIIYTRGDQKVRGKVLLNCIAFIDFNENS